MFLVMINRKQKHRCAHARRCKESKFNNNVTQRGRGGAKNLVTAPCPPRPGASYWICALKVTTPCAFGTRLPVKVQDSAPAWPAAGPVMVPLVRPVGVTT